MIVVLPNALEWATRKGLIVSGFVLSNVRGKRRTLTVAHWPARKLARTPKRESAVEAIFQWLAPEMHR